jgi:SNF2 family DNA or RNA helicase
MAFDEGHRLASYNPNSRKNTQMGKALSRLRREHVKMALNLTGSGIMNRGDDLFGQLHFLFPKIYRAKWADWNDRFIDTVNDGNREVPIGFKVDKLPELRRELGVFMVYRKKAEVFDLPPLIEQPIELDLYPEQRRVYNDMRDQFWAALEEGGIKAANPLAQMNMLRRIATYYPGVPSAKLDFALHELEETPDEQFVVFTWYKEPGRALADRLGDEVVVVDGDVPIRHRAELLARHKLGKARILVGSIATLGESLNLQYMHEAIRLDRDWNPQVNGQTIDRLNRNGQETRVTLRDLWARGTVDTLRVRPNLASKDSLRKAVFG